MNKKLVLLIGITLMVVAGYRWYSNTQGPGTKENLATLNGKWVSDCFNDSDKKGSYRVIYNFKDIEYKMNQINFSNPGCKTPTVIVSEVGVFHLRNTVSSGHFDIDMKRIREVWRVTDFGLIEEFQTKKTCGVSEWVDEVDVTGKECMGRPVAPVGVPRFDIVKLEEGQLYFGMMSPEQDTTTLEKRPVNFALDTAFQRFAKKSLTEFKVIDG